MSKIILIVPCDFTAPPDDPKIKITNGIDKFGSHDEKIIVTDLSSIACSIRNGHPAPKLHWKINEIKYESKEEIVQNGENRHVEISLNISLHKSIFAKGDNHITCIATQSGTHTSTSMTIEYIDEGRDCLFTGLNKVVLECVP